MNKIVEARLSEILKEKELKVAHYDRRLPEEVNWWWGKNVDIEVLLDARGGSEIVPY